MSVPMPASHDCPQPQSQRYPRSVARHRPGVPWASGCPPGAGCGPGVSSADPSRRCLQAPLQHPVLPREGLRVGQGVLGEAGFTQGSAGSGRRSNSRVDPAGSRGAEAPDSPPAFPGPHLHAQPHAASRAWMGPISCANFSRFRSSLCTQPGPGPGRPGRNGEVRPGLSPAPPSLQRGRWLQGFV